MREDKEAGYEVKEGRGNDHGYGVMSIMRENAGCGVMYGWYT